MTILSRRARTRLRSRGRWRLGSGSATRPAVARRLRRRRSDGGAWGGAADGVIDPGTGESTMGRNTSAAEKNVTLDVGERLEKILEGLKVRTVLTRRDDVCIAAKRAEIANMVAGRTQCDFVSIHFINRRSRAWTG